MIASASIPPASLALAWSGLRHFATEAAIQQGVCFLGAVLYGSRARGEARPDSDYDVAVLLRGSRSKDLDPLLDLGGLAYDVLLDTALDISPLPVWEAEWRNPALAPNPALIRAIQRDGILIPLLTVSGCGRAAGGMIQIG